VTLTVRNVLYYIPSIVIYTTINFIYNNNYKILLGNIEYTSVKSFFMEHTGM